MQWPVNRRLFMLLPLTRWLLGNQSGATPDGSPETVPYGQSGGLEGSRYTSPSFGWSMTINRTIWDVTVDVTDGDSDALTLRAHEQGGQSSASVTFRTTHPGDQTLEERMLEIRKDELPEQHQGATITVGEAEDFKPIYGLFQTENTEEKTDDHWIASYVARYGGERSGDAIIELDIIGIPDAAGVLVIHAVSDPDDYDEYAFEQVETLRHSFYEESQATSGAMIPSALSTLRAGGGSRPRVQY